MELKNALSICLIALFSATLVVLIARSLDLNAAKRLEPQLAKIAEELQAIRVSGGMATVPGTAATDPAPRDGLVVYYFHSTKRCPTCRAMEAQTRATLERDFAAQLASGEIVWKTGNYEDPSIADLVRKFKLQMSVVVLARMKDGRIDDWKRLDAVWGLVDDKPAFAEFMQSEIRKMLGQETEAAAELEETSAIRVSADEATELPLPE